ncbi:TPA: saccharopine dehydrogenase, partial [Candidatus Micrarchaeota archaeon]|nr:saccharopine dehydrogenase [Candidatus Micrarchaeota archaeon]
MTWYQLDVERPDEARDRLRTFDLAVIALGPMEHVCARAHNLCMEAGVDCVDINDSLAAADAILDLDQQAAANGCRIYTGLGLTPGLSTLLLLQLAHENASATGLYRSRLYMGAAHGGGKASPHALVASFRKQLEVYSNSQRQRITTPWRDAASRFRFPGHDQPLDLIPYATPETATLARAGAEVGITGLDSRFHVQFLPQGLARAIAAIAPGPAMRGAVARRFYASGQTARRRQNADPATTLWVYPDDRPQDGLVVHGPLSAYDLTAAMACAVVDGIVAGWLRTPPGVWSLDGGTPPDQLRQLGNALHRRGVLIRPASVADNDTERFRFGWCQPIDDSVRTLRHYHRSWYSAAVPLPSTVGRLQRAYLRQSE